jgi:hypothetical protein
MVRYFDDFALNAINYRPRWIEVTKGANTHRVRDNEGMKVFQRQGWTATLVGYVRLYGGLEDTGTEHTMAFDEYIRVTGR